MKHCLLFLLTILIAHNYAMAQRPVENAKPGRCGTMEALQYYWQQHPQPRIQPLPSIEKAQRAQNNNRTTNTVLTIPVVVHLVLPAAEQAKVTEADVRWQIEQLNKDFSGLNEDSTNGAAFYAQRGHSAIRFCLAQQDAAGNPTNGINRIVTSITNFTPFTVARLKSGGTCGSDAWDTDRYFNIWVAKSTSILGVATFPGTGPASEQGIAIALEAFSNNPAYVTPEFGKGRTVVHETGHFLGLFHSWGDDDDCNASDFRQLPGTCLITGSDIVGGDQDLTVGDTPNQGAPTVGCPGGTKTDACNNTVTGVQYQNFMDYTSDACYSMFTALQVKRMEYLLTSCRSSLTTSNGCTPPARFTNDVQLNALINPGKGSCKVSGNTSFCLGSAINPLVEIMNVGTSVLTSAKIVVQLGNGTATEFSWTGSLQPFEKTVVTLPAVTASTTGNQAFIVFTKLPNGATDLRATNDTLKTDVTVTGVTTLAKVEEGFSSTVFPPQNWKVNNPDGDLTWAHTTQAGKKAPGAAWFNDWENATNDRFDDLVMPAFSYNDVDSVFLHFQLSSAMYSNPNTIAPIDTLSVLLSKDCGNTYTTVYKKWGKDLQTITGTWPQDKPFIPRSAVDWRRDSVNLGIYLGSTEPQFQVAFRFHGNFENNFYLDDVTLYTRVLPQTLKQKGFLILPTVTRSSFAIWHYQQPTTLRSVFVYNAAGQLMVKMLFNKNAEKYITVNLQDQPAGVYLVHLNYDDASQNVTQRIVKQ